MIKDKTLYLGVDCGGTNIKLALVDSSGKVIRSRMEKMNYNSPYEVVISKISKDIKKFLGGRSKVVGIGIGIAGDVDQTKGVVRFSPNLGWKNVPLKDLLGKDFKETIFVENDANCAALGAYVLDAKRDCENLICLTLGTGIGGGIILNSKLYRGSTGSAGELGHMTIHYNGKPCKCGNFGCAESYIGAWGLIQNAQEGLRKNLAPILAKLIHNKEDKLEPKIISLAAKKGDPYCQQLWRDTGEQLGALLSNCVNSFNPDRIVLCGGVSKAGDQILKPALHSLGARAFAAPVQKVQVTLSQYDAWLGVVGAALLFTENKN